MLHDTVLIMVLPTHEPLLSQTTAVAAAVLTNLA